MNREDTDVPGCRGDGCKSIVSGVDRDERCPRVGKRIRVSRFKPFFGSFFMVYSHVVPREPGSQKGFLVT